MFVSSNPDDEDRWGGSLQTATLFGYAGLLIGDAETPGTSMEGTIGASIQMVAEPDFYAQGSETVIRGAPVTQQTHSTAAAPQLRAKDLIAELNAINTQIHQIMFQVERAVSRLATSG